jgi:hypothetical protein
LEVRDPSQPDVPSRMHRQTQDSLMRFQLNDKQKPQALVCCQYLRLIWKSWIWAALRRASPRGREGLRRVTNRAAPECTRQLGETSSAKFSA